MAEKLILDNELVEECQREQQRMLGYCDTRDVVGRNIADLMRAHPELSREQIVWQLGQSGTPDPNL